MADVGATQIWIEPAVDIPGTSDGASGAARVGDVLDSEQAAPRAASDAPVTVIRIALSTETETGRRNVALMGLPGKVDGTELQVAFGEISRCSRVTLGRIFVAKV